MAMTRRKHQRKRTDAEPKSSLDEPKGWWLCGRYWIWGAILAVMVLTAIVRTNLLEVPLERDEGEYAYAGQLILQGLAPYEHLYNMKMPGIYGAYALILAGFGHTHGGIHLGLMVINAASIVLMFFLGRRLLGPVGGVGAAGAFAVASASQSVQGVFANAEHFVILPVLGGIVLLLWAIEVNRLRLLAGGAVLLGLCFLMKQHGAAFIAFGGLYLLICELRRRPFNGKIFTVKGLIFLVCALLPFGLTCLIFRWVGAFDRFWFWTFDYARECVSANSLEMGLENFKSNALKIFESSMLLWITAGLGLTALLWSKSIRRQSLFVGGFLLFSFLAVCPGLNFRPHYFVLFLPAAGLLVGAAIKGIYELGGDGRMAMASRAMAILLGLAAIAHGVWYQRAFFFADDPAKVSRAIYKGNPFPESLEIARVIKENTTKDDRIAIIGSEPQIYFYSNRRAATGYIYTYALMEDHPYALKMQQDMIREIEANNPKFMLFVRISSSWLVRAKSEKLIFNWFEQYCQNNYTIYGMIDIRPQENTVYRWGEENCRGYDPRLDCEIAVFKRKI